MRRLIDADELGKVKFHPLPYTHIVPNGENAQSYERGWNDAIDAIIENAPTVDAVHAVRCKDCRYMDDTVKNFGWDGMCNFGGKQECTMYNRFCSDGDRRGVME